MKDDLWEVVDESRASSFVFKDLNNTMIALILKNGNVSSFDDLRPISLCNSVYKVISKVMANRLTMVLGTIISEEQRGFAPNRSIVEGIIIAHEAIHSIRLAGTEKTFVKLDTKKAYDNVDISFLFKVLDCFGFGQK